MKERLVQINFLSSYSSDLGNHSPVDCVSFTQIYLNISATFGSLQIYTQTQ